MQKLTSCFPLVVLFLSLFFSSDFTYAQKMEQSTSFRDLQSDNYFRLNYDNDLFTSSDQNYTQGINLEFGSPVLKKNPLNFLLLKPKKSNNNYGLALEHLCYTPSNIKSTEIQTGDRPFAAAIFLKSFIVASDSVHKSRISSSLSLGVIGPLAFGNEMQTTIHRITKNTLPEGWHNQIANNLVLNYALSYEKQLFRYRNLFSLQSNSNAQVGTLFTHASLGMNIQIGKLNFSYSSAKNKFQVYFYAQSLFNFIGYNATLQGGLIHDKSPYVVSQKDIKRITLQYNFGIVLQTKKLYAEFGVTALSGEVVNISPTGWGGVKLGCKF